MKLSEFPKTSRDTEIGRLIREVRRRYNLADEVARKFMLASALEPLSNKDGCTTRFVDLKESKRLELFVAAGINSGFAIRHLVDHLIVNKTLIGSYKFMIEAVVTSKLNRKGGKINHGILEAIIPLIATQVIFYDKIKDEPSMIFGLVGPLLSNTGKEDVEDLLQAKRIANKISGVEKKYPLRQHKVVSIYDYYFFEVNAELAEGNLTAVLHNQQFLDGFSDIKDMLRVMASSKKERLLEKVEDAYNFIRNKHDNKIGVGLAADHCAICLYLYISLIDHREVIG